MKKQLSRIRIAFLGIASSLMVLALSPSAEASTAYGTLNNFDCVNDVVDTNSNGVECHGFEIELDDIHSKDITYTYDYNHYGIPKITESTFLDANNVSHPRVVIRYAATWTGSAWTAYTAVPSGPISPTDGHQFTNPSVNFGGEHFGVGYYGAPTAVRYHWLIDDGSHNLIPGPLVYIATPTFVYYPPAFLQPAQVQAAIVPPPPPDPPVLEFGVATWVKDIKTETHNPNKVELRDLVDPDPDGVGNDWRNGEPDEVETEWRILQTEFANVGVGNGELEGAPEDLPDGDEVITRRYEFYKYVGPLDPETGEVMTESVGPDDIHGVGDYADVVVVGDFIGAQMAGFDVAPVLGLIDHIPDGEIGVPYAERTVVVAGGAAFLATVSGSLPNGTTLDVVTGIFSGTPDTPGVSTFTVAASDTSGAAVSKTYTVTIPEVVPTTGRITTSASPAGGGTTAGGGTFDNGTQISVVATHNAGYAFVNWTEGGLEVSNSAVYPFTVNGDRTLVANFICSPSAEVCNGLDDDCNGSIDDGLAPVATTCGVGACAATGTQTCVDGVLTDSCTPGNSSAEVCNGLDDDCNGLVDDGIAPACCDTDSDCDDGNACTTDRCENSVCTHGSVADCCQTDADCDDGLFCNGQERCNAVAGCIPAGRPPCPPPFCDEINNRCDPRPGPKGPNERRGK